MYKNQWESEIHARRNKKKNGLKSGLENLSKKVRKAMYSFIHIPLSGLISESLFT